MAQLRQLTEANARLKRLMADLNALPLEEVSVLEHELELLQQGPQTVPSEGCRDFSSTLKRELEQSQESFATCLWWVYSVGEVR